MIIVPIVFFGLLLIGTPIGYVLGIAGFVGLIGQGTNYLPMGPDNFFSGLNNFTFMAMPFFILAGEIMNQTGITRRLADFADALVGYLRGGLAHSTMIASVIFAGMTGAAVSDAAAFGNTLVPAMVKQGYKRPFACAVVVAGSIIGPTIPPSNLMVIYGSLAGVSVAGMFAAGILPGLLIAVVCMAFIGIFGKRLDLPVSDRKFSWIFLAKSFWGSLTALFMPVLILGFILGGITTPTEAAAIAVAYAAFIGVFVYRTLTFKATVEMLIRTARVTAVVFLIISSASILSWWMTEQRIPQLLGELFLSISRNPLIVKAMILALLLIIGCVMDINAALIILTPMLGALTLLIGMHPVHAGIMIVLSLNIGLMTPPVGACLFVLCSVTGEKLENISAAIWPFIVLEVLVLVAITFLDEMTLFMPRLLGLV